MTTDRKTRLLDMLREETGDRPAHRALLDDLIAWHEAGRPGGDDAEPHDDDGRSGVTFEVYVALAGDVTSAFTGMQGATLAYPALRAKHRAAGVRRRETMAGPSGTGLENRFRMLGGGRD